MPSVSPKGSRKTAPVLPVATLKIARVRDYNTLLNTLIRDERLSPNRRFLASLLSQYFSLGKKHGKEVSMTDQEKIDKSFLYNILLTQFGNPKNIQWQDREDVGSDTLNVDNLQPTDTIRDAFAEAMKPVTKEDDAAIQS